MSNYIKYYRHKHEEKATHEAVFIDNHRNYSVSFGKIGSSGQYSFNEEKFEEFLKEKEFVECPALVR